MSIHLDDIEKKNHFHVEEGYFDKLTSDIQERIEVPESTFEFKKVWLLAPVLAMVIVISFVFYQNYDGISENRLADISDNDILLYLSNQELADEELALLVNNTSDLFSTESIELDFGDEDLENLYDYYDLDETI